MSDGQPPASATEPSTGPSTGPRGAHPALDEILDLLALEPVEADLFLGRNERRGPPRIFGGQVLAQALQAAARTVDGRAPHSLHGYFLRPGDPARRILFEVERVRDGGSFTTRRVRAIQRGEPIFAASASFHEPEAGLDHQLPMPERPGPEGLEDDVVVAQRLADRGVEVMPWQVRERAFEARAVFPLDAPAPAEPIKPSWFRTRAPVPPEQEAALPALHACLLAYVSDMGLMSTSLVPHAETTPRSRIIGASLDHVLWFHRPFRTDEWFLYDRDAPTSAASRGFNRGLFFDHAGVLFASTAQESLIRVRRPKAS